MTAINTITTAEQLFQAGDIGRCELVRGKLVTMSPTSFHHGGIAAKITRLLGNHVEAKKLGYVGTSDPGFIIERNPDTVRAPDVAFLRTKKAKKAPIRGFFPGTPDLAVEVLSPDDRVGEVSSKTQEWLAAGCELVWVVDPFDKTLTAYTADGGVIRYQGNDEVPGSPVLPDFSMSLSELFRA